MNEAFDLFPEVALLEECFDAAGFVACLLQKIVYLFGDQFVEHIHVITVKAAHRVNCRGAREVACPLIDCNGDGEASVFAQMDPVRKYSVVRVYGARAVDKDGVCGDVICDLCFVFL